MGKGKTKVMEIIGVSGYARSGKDEFAAVLVEEFGFVRVAFADKLREMLYALDPLISVWREWDSEPSAVYVQDVINKYGWNGYKETMYKDEIRRLLQRLGTEAGRETLWNNIWVDAAFAQLNPDAKVVVTDTRFTNEADAIRARGGKVIRIKRLGIGPINDHVSETGLDNYSFDNTILNSGSLKDYQELVRNLRQEGMI